MKFTLLSSFLLLANAFNSKRSFQFKFPGDASSYAELDGTLTHELTDFTLCHWSKTNLPISELTWETIFNYYLPNKDHSIRTQIRHNKFAGVNADSRWVQATLDSPNNNEWIHLCVIWSVTDGAFDFFIGGQHVANKTHSRPANSIQPNGIVLLAVSVKNYSPLKGQVSEINLWDYTLIPSEVIKVYNCQDQFEGNVIAWSNSIWKLHNATTVSQVSLPCHRRD